MSDQIDINTLDVQDENERELAQQIASDEWLRVSPIAIAYFFFKTLYFLIFNVLIYMLPVFAFNLNKLKEHPVEFGLGALGLMSLVLIGSVIKYFFYFYRLSADRVEIRQGMIQKSHMDLPFGKIQNVKIIQPFYYRFSNYSIIELDTAGSAKQEANIVAIQLPLAESFKQKVQANVTDVSATPQDASKDVSDSHAQSSEKSSFHTQETLLNRRSIKDLIIHGVTNNRVWIFLGAAAPFYEPISQNLDSVLTAVGLDISSYLNYEQQSLGIFLLHVLSLVMIIMLLIVIFSIIGAIFVFFDYRLSKSGERYIRRSGLLTKHEVSMKCSRIQRVVQQQDWLDILIGRVNLRFEQNSAGAYQGDQASQMTSANKLIVPSVTPTEADALSQDAFAFQTISSLEYQRISPRYILRLFLFPCSPFVLLAAVFAIYQATILSYLLGFIVIVMLCLSCVLAWYRWGYYEDEDFIYIRKGFLGRDFIAFPIDKVQQTKITQTPFMRKGQLATLRIVLASGGMVVPYLPEEQVKATVDKLLLRVEKNKPAWM
uniref:PH domain-containing protein n=1 Tax=Ningiella ruwaisensis TaxID=2364274 RepID=UPI00109FC28F|nr:PH domain-containing protein [Ningiella ruwaisensis]